MKHLMITCALLATSAYAETKKPKKPVTARIVDFEVREDARIVTVLAGSEQGIGKTWRAKFREGTTTKPLAGGDAIVIRIDRRTTVLKTSLSADQVRANRTIQFEP